MKAVILTEFGARVLRDDPPAPTHAFARDPRVPPPAPARSSCACAPHPVDGTLTIRIQNSYRFRLGGVARGLT